MQPQSDVELWVSSSPVNTSGGTIGRSVSIPLMQQEVRYVLPYASAASSVTIVQPRATSGSQDLERDAGVTDASDIKERLRAVEGGVSALNVSVARIETTLQHMPTTWKAIGIVAAGVVAAVTPVLGALWWIAQQFLEPLLRAGG